MKLNIADLASYRPIMNWYTNGWFTWASHLVKKGFIIGDPKPSDECSVEYLKSLGIVGFYSIIEVPKIVFREQNKR